LRQMEKFIPADQRQQGLALAKEMEQQGVAALQPGGRAEPVGREGPPPLQTAQLPAPAEAETPSLPKSPPAAAPKAKAAAVKPSPVKPAPAKAASAKPAAPRPAAAGNWRVQLGAFSEEARARQLWNRLNAKVSGLSAYQLYLVKGGAMTRLQAGPLTSAAEAERLCGAIKAAGADCMPRKM
ncbi:MAG TPA: SPOR domain-containing protein, partial [Sphingobium sp.]|nr:SPOR domain-containing protein [Sphingobium sp.]